MKQERTLWRGPTALPNRVHALELGAELGAGDPELPAEALGLELGQGLEPEELGVEQQPFHW